MPDASTNRATNRGTDRATDRAGSAAASMPLDDYTTNLTGAWSLNRQLLTSYAGSAFKVRNASTAAETDIGFDSSGNLDTAALDTACSGANGFIVTIYDQSGNSYDLDLAAAATANSQPKVYDSVTGALTSDGHVVCYCEGSDDGLEVTMGDLSSNPGLDLYVVFQEGASAANSAFFWGLGSGGGGQYITLQRDSATVLSHRFGNGYRSFDESHDLSDGLYVHHTRRVEGATHSVSEHLIDGTTLAQNAVASGTNTPNITTTPRFSFGYRPGGVGYQEMYFAEAILFSTSTSSTNALDSTDSDAIDTEIDTAYAAAGASNLNSGVALSIFGAGQSNMAYLTTGAGADWLPPGGEHFDNRAVGGTLLEEWEKSTGQYYQPLVDEIVNRPSGGDVVLWWAHGEADSKLQTTADTYLTRLTQMASDLDTDCSAHSLYWVVAKLHADLDATTYPYQATTRQALADFVSADPTTRVLLDLDAYDLSVDNIHHKEENRTSILDDYYTTTDGLGIT